MRAKPLAALQAFVWIGLVGAFFVVGAPRVFRGVTTGYLLPATSASSIDAYLTVVQENRALSQLLIRMFNTVPDDKPVVIIDRADNDQSTLLAMLMAYLAWPHRVRIVAVSPATAHRQLSELDLPSAGALVTCRVPLPPGVGGGFALADDVRVVIPPSAPAK